MIAWALQARPALDRHIRRFMPQRDLSALADLVEVAFGEDLARTGSPMVHDLRQMALAGPLLQLAGPLAAFLNGYVWMEDGCLVGNVSVAHKGRGIWSMTNVAVLPEYRGRGIAGQLVDAGIAHVRQQGGRRIVLQVRADNDAARTLYLHRGFCRFDTWHELNLAARDQASVVGPPNADLRRSRLGDTRQLWQLARDSVIPATQHCLPLERADFRRDLAWLIGRSLRFAFSGRETLELVAPRQGDLAACIRLSTNLGRHPYELLMYVAQGQRGRWESALLDGLLTRAADLPTRDWRTYVSDTHPEALEACGRCAFETLRVLDQMALELG